MFLLSKRSSKIKIIYEGYIYSYNFVFEEANSKLKPFKNLVLNYLSLLKTVYESLFPNRVLAEHPNPWRIQFILEIVYGGWTLIRRSVKAIFHKCKDVQYGTLLNFLDNYCPLVLSSYNILFKTNNFPKYYEPL